MSATTITALRELCTACEATQTDKFVGNQRLYARNLNVVESNGARRGILATSQMGDMGLMTVYPNAIDGAEFKWEEVIPAIVQSRSTGGLSKTECGHDPQSLKVKNHLKRQYTERLYIHRAECMLKYIGSTYQGSAGSGPKYIGDGDSLLKVSSNTDLIVDLFVQDARSFAKAIDGSVILGNFTGDNQTGIVNSGLSTYPHFDGVLKQISQNADAAYYATVDVTLPTVGAGAFFVKWYGTWIGSGTTTASLVTLINAVVNEAGDAMFSSYDKGTNVLRVTANNEEQEVYGMGLLEVYYGSTGTIDSCDLALDATIIENPMPYAEQPLLFDYSETISATNFYSYFRDVIKAWQKHVIQLSENGSDLFSGERAYIACDPLLLVDKDFAYLEELGSGYNQDNTKNYLEGIFPDFKGIKVLEGTGLWFMTFSSNLVFLTNMDGTQPQMGVWYDQDCDKVKGRMEMLGNVLVLDHAAFASNVKNSPFENILRDPYSPENLPHLAPECRSDSITGYSAYASRAAARVTVAANASDWDIRLQDTSILTEGRTISTYAWTFYVATGTGAIQPASQVADVTTLFTTAQKAAVVNVTLVITLDNGDTDTVVIPAAEFIAI